MAQAKRKTTAGKRGGKSSSSSFRVAAIVVLCLLGLGVWLYYNQPDDTPKKSPTKKEVVQKASPVKRALELSKQNPDAEVFDIQSDEAKKKSPDNSQP